MYMTSLGELVVPSNITTTNGSINTTDMYEVNGNQIAVTWESGLNQTQQSITCNGKHAEKGAHDLVIYTPSATFSKLFLYF